MQFHIFLSENLWFWNVLDTDKKCPTLYIYIRNGFWFCPICYAWRHFRFNTLFLLRHFLSPTVVCVCVSVYLDYHCQYMNFISFAFLTIFYWHSEEQMWNQIAHQSSASIDAWSDCDNLGMCWWIFRFSKLGHVVRFHVNIDWGKCLR